MKTTNSLCNDRAHLVRARPNQGAWRWGWGWQDASGLASRLARLALLTTLVLAAGSVALAAETDLDAALAEYEEALAKTANIENGRSAYLTCAVCHSPEGWGTVDGVYPQIAGQLPSVIIKQLADFRAGNRINPLMYPFSVARILGGPQQMADVAAYVSQLPMTPHNGIGPGADLELGERIYREKCADCHGDRGQGNAQDHVPAVAGQHYLYLERQFAAIRSGERRNSDPEMVKQIKGFNPREESAVLDYVARLRPPAERLAQDGWLNPDFPGYVRDAMRGMPPPPPPPPMMPRPPEPPVLLP